MIDQLIAKVETLIKAPAAEVWKALTDPALVKQYFFGVDVETDWQVGSPIIYKGEWEGQAFEEKGVILEMEPEKRMVSSYYSPSTGLPDSPENYQVITYELQEIEGGTHLSITQENNRSEESRAQSEQNWQLVLDGLKKLVES